MSPAPDQFDAARDVLLAMLESSREGICAFDREWRFTYVNREAARMAGREAGEMLGRCAWELFPEAVGTEVWEALHRAAREQTPVEMTYFSQVANRWLNLRAVPSPDGLATRARDVTEHKVLEEAHFLSEKRLRQALDAGQCGIYEWDLGSGRVTWTQKLHEFFGISPEKFSGTPEEYLRTIHPDDVERAQQSVKACIEADVPPRMEYRIVRPDGEVRWIYTSGAVVRDESGRPVRMLGACIDTTERRMAEESLKQRERIMAQAQRMAQVGGWEKDLLNLDDPSRNELRWADECYRIFGYEPRSVKVTSEMFYEAVHPEDRARVAAAVSAALREGRPYEVEHRIARPDGTQRVVHQWGSVVKDATGRPARMLGTCQDVTDQRAAEQAVRASEERYHMLTNAVVQLMWVNDAEGRASFRNRRWYEYTGIVEDERAPSKTDIIHPEDDVVVDRIRERAIAAGEPYEIEYRLRRHDGQYRWHLGRVVPMKDAAGRVINWFGTATDVHDMKIAEREMAKSRQEAEAANKAKDQFLAVLSHELRTPLTPVVMTVAAMEMDRTLSPQMREDLAMIRRNIELETKLIDDLLDVTRIINGKLRLQPRLTDVHALLLNVQEIMRGDIHCKRLKVAVLLSAGDAQVSGDPARLQQVFWNLVKNAIKFTPAGGNIHIRTSNPGNKAISIEVSDDGVGIDHAALPKIFDAFDQGDQSVTRQFGGLGLGLAISKALTDLHGGTIRAFSDGKGRGSRFVVELPTVGQVRKIVEQIQPMGPGASGPRLRVLLVEDHVDTQKTLRRLLEERGFSVACASSVAGALAMLAREPIDVLVSDIGLPDATGHELMRNVRRLYQLPGIALSGFGMDSDIKNSHDAGFTAHLTKPVDVEQLAALIRACPAPAGVSSEQI